MCTAQKCLLFPLELFIKIYFFFFKFIIVQKTALSARPTLMGLIVTFLFCFGINKKVKAVYRTETKIMGFHGKDN